MEVPASEQGRHRRARGSRWDRTGDVSLPQVGQGLDRQTGSASHTVRAMRAHEAAWIRKNGPEMWTVDDCSSDLPSNYVGSVTCCTVTGNLRPSDYVVE